LFPIQKKLAKVLPRIVGAYYNGRVIGRSGARGSRLRSSISNGLRGNYATLLRLIEMNRSPAQDRSGTLAGLQYAFPSLDFMPIGLIRNYDQLSGLARSYISSAEAAGTPLTHSA
jgi:hypothetical protein